MAFRFAYHKDVLRQEFPQSYYYTDVKRSVDVGDTIYVISGSRPPMPTYFLEGRYHVASIDPPEGDRNKKRVNLVAEARGPTRLSINGEPWFKREGFRNRFVSGQSMNRVPDEYRKRFDSMLKSFDGESRNVEPTLDAINDLGTNIPDRALSVTTRYQRDPAVRNAVKRRAKGKCELCEELGFVLADGSRYVECHHIIALANEGADRVTNVIALCANHHREAHHGERGEELEKKMLLIIAKLRE